MLAERSARDWRPALIEALRTPYSYPPVGTLGALGWRLRRNYLWIYAAELLTLELADRQREPVGVRQPKYSLSTCPRRTRR